MPFEYDPEKSRANAAKHGIDFEQARALWTDDGRIRVASRASVDEERWLVIGRIGDKLWTAIVTYRADAVRLISVRRARDEERTVYDRQND